MSSDLNWVKSAADGLGATYVTDLFHTYQAVNKLTRDEKERKALTKAVIENDFEKFIEHREAYIKDERWTKNRQRNFDFLNNKWVSVSSDIEIIITTFHEVRHAYQYYCIVNEINHTRQVLEEWKDNFDNYISPTLNEDSDEKYLTQPIEKDAILWTHNIVLELFEIKTVIPKVLKALK